MTINRTKAPTTFVLPDWGYGVVGSACFLLLLQLLPTVGVVNPKYLPPASEMFVALSRYVVNVDFWSSLSFTLITWGIGLGVALAAGVGVGMLLGSVTWLREFTASTIEFLRPVPSIALLPVAVLLLGTGMSSTLVLVIYASFWQVLMQVMAGVQDVDPVAADTAKSYRFRPMTKVTKVLWPTTLPFAMTGLRLAASVALVVTVICELLISGAGVGGMLALARESGAVASMYGLVIVAGVLGILVNLLARLIEQRVLSWHPSIRSEMAS